MTSSQVRNAPLFGQFIYKKRSFCQDRLGTNIAKPLKKDGIISFRLEKTLQEIRSMASESDGSGSYRQYAYESAGLCLRSLRAAYRTSSSLATYS
jgi:hypothetical protein